MSNLWKRTDRLTITNKLTIPVGGVLEVAGNTIDGTEFGTLDVVPGTATASKALVLDASKGIATITSATITTLTSPTVNSTNVDAGASGTAGSVDVFPATAAKGKLAITCTDQTGNTTVSLVAGAMAAARTITVPDPGAAASVLMTTGAATATSATTTEISQLAGTTAGTAVASKALVVDANKDIISLRNVAATNYDAGASGTAGTVDVFPTTAAKGKLAVTCTDQTGDTTVSLVAGAMAAARTITIPDPGAAASVLMTTGTATATSATTTEINFVAGVTAGTATASKAVVLGASKEIATITSATITTLTSDALRAGAAGQFLQTQVTATAKTTSTTLTAAELLTGIITVNQGGGATSSLTLPLATSMDTALTASVANDAFDFSLINISTNAAEDADILTNTGWTLVGSMAVQSNDAITSKSACMFRARKTATGAWTLYRLS